MNTKLTLNLDKEVIEQAKTSLNMGHFDFDRFLDEEEVEEVLEEVLAEEILVHCLK
jgi:hypothetical protein